MAETEPKAMDLPSSLSDFPQSVGRVLVLEPIQPLRQHLIELVQEEPALESCGGVSSTADALTVLRELEPDLVLVGSSLAPGGAWAAVRELRKAGPNCKLLVLSRDHRAAHASRMLLAGADGYATLEDLEELTDAMQDVLAGALFVSDKVSSNQRPEKRRRAETSDVDAFGCSAEERSSDVCAAAID